MMERTLSDLCAGALASRSAAIGETRLARRAGMYAAMIVTTVPTRYAVIGVAALKTRDVPLRFMPMPLMRALSPTARPKPAARPSVDPTMPSSRASKRTDRRTCLPLAPMARMRPSSRVRWATSIWKVLKIRKMPTSTAMPAKASITYLMMSMNEPISSAASLAASALVLTSKSAPSACWTVALSWSLVTPAAASSSTEESLSGEPSSAFCAYAVSRKTSVAPGLVVVNVAMPTTLVWIRPFASMSAALASVLPTDGMIHSESPMSMFFLSAVSASTTTSPGARGT